MSDEIKTKVTATTELTSSKPLGFLTDPSGDLSSGRLIKLLSWCMAGALAVAYFCGRAWISNFSMPEIVGLVGIFAGIAAGSEIVQKLTGT
jgi:hypothetical protein